MIRVIIYLSHSSSILIEPNLLFLSPKGKPYYKYPKTQSFYPTQRIFSLSSPSNHTPATFLSHLSWLSLSFLSFKFFLSSSSSNISSSTRNVTKLSITTKFRALCCYHESLFSTCSRFFLVLVNFFSSSSRFH